MFCLYVCAIGQFASYSKTENCRDSNASSCVIYASFSLPKLLWNVPESFSPYCPSTPSCFVILIGGGTNSLPLQVMEKLENHLRKDAQFDLQQMFLFVCLFSGSRLAPAGRAWLLETVTIPSPAVKVQCLLSEKVAGPLYETLLPKEDKLYYSATLLREKSEDAPPPVDLRQYCR